MKKLAITALLAMSCSVLLGTSATAAVKAGGTCTKAGSTNIVSGKKYTCVNSGKKLVWDSRVATSNPAAPKTSTPVQKPIAVTVTFDNLLQNQSNISFTVWKNSSDTISSNDSKTGSLTIYTGPNTRVFFDNIPYPMSLVSKLFPNKSEAKDVLWIRYDYSDIKWAEKTAKEKLLPDDYNQIVQNQGGTLTSSNCDSSSKNCRGSYQQTGHSGIALIMQGVENPPASKSLVEPRMLTGMLEAHEYFHSLQRIPIMSTGVQVWPPAWWREGSAEWVQNATINYNNYADYKKYLLGDCSNGCEKLSEADIAEFLTKANDNFIPPKFDQWLNYSLGSHVIEKLVAIKGKDVLIDMYAEMGKGETFSEAFKMLFGVSWKSAIPVLAKSIYVDLHN